MIPVDELKNRARALAAVDDSENAAAAVSLLTVTSGDRVYAMPVAHVLEVIGQTRVCPVPSASAVLEGIVNHRGDITPVISLAGYFGHRGTEGTGTIVVASINGCTAAFRSDAEPRLLDVSPHAIRGIDGGSDLRAPAVRGLVEDGGHSIAVLALEHMVRPGIFGAPVAADNTEGDAQ